jgi:hypothetical protein
VSSKKWVLLDELSVVGTRQRGLITKTGHTSNVHLWPLHTIIIFTVFERVLSHGRFGSHAILAQILVCIAFIIPFPTRLTQEVRR